MATAREDRLADEFLSLLTQPMQRKPREAVHRRHTAMMSELRFRRGREDPHLNFLHRKGWSDARFSALFAINCVYQEVLGPLQASSRSCAVGLGTRYPIRHGSLSFDRAHARGVNQTIHAFVALTSRLGFKREWLTRNTCGDLLYYIYRHEREE